MAGEDKKIQVDVVVNSGDSEKKIQSLRQEIAQLRTDIEKGARDGGSGIVNVKGIKSDVDSAIRYMDKLQKELAGLEATYTRNIEKKQINDDKAYNKYLNQMREKERLEELSRTKAFEASEKQKRLDDARYNKYLNQMVEKERREELSRTKMYEKQVVIPISQAKERTAIQEQNNGYNSVANSAKESAGVFSQLDINSAQNRELAALASQDAYYNRFSKSAKDSAGVFGSQMGFDVRPVQSYKQELALLNREQEKNYRLWKQTGDTKYKEAFDTVGVSVKSLTKEMNAYKISSGQAETAMGAFARRAYSHAQWIVSGAALTAAIVGPTLLVDKLSELEQEFNQLKTVIPEIHEDQTKYNQAMQDAFGLAERYGTKIKDVTDSLRLMGRGYHELSTTEKLAENALKLSVADNFSPEVATKALEAVIGGYNEQAHAVQFSARVMDSMTSISHNAQVSANDLAEALMRSAAAAHTVGVGFDELSAMAATIARNTGLTGQTIGDGLKSMLNSIHTDKAIKDLQAFGVEVYKTGEDGKREFRSISDVLLDVGTKAESAGVNIEKLFKDLSGGKFQVTKMAALLGDPDEYLRVLGKSINSTGFTDKQLAIQMDTIARKAETLRTSFEQLANSMGNQSGFAKFVKDMIDGLNQLLKGLNAISPATWDFIGSAGKIAVTLVVAKESVLLMGKAFAGLAKATSDATKAQIVLDAVTSKTPWGALAKAIALAATALGVWAYAEGELAKSQEDNSKKRETAIDAMKSQADMQERQIPLIETLGNRYQQLQAAEAQSAVGSQEYNDIKKKQESIHKTLAETVGEEAASQILSSDNINEAVKGEQETLKQAIAQKRKELIDYRLARSAELDDEIDHVNNCIEAYQRDLKAFGDTIAGKIALIGVLKAAQVTAMEWQDKGLELQRDRYLKLADMAPDGSKQKEEYQKQVDQLDYQLENNREYAQKLMEGPLEGYRAKAEELSKQKFENAERIVSSGNKESDTGEVTDAFGTTKGGKGGSSSSPHDSNRPARDALKMEQEKLFHDAKLAQDRYTESLDNLKTHEEIYGKTVASSNEELDVKQKRSLALAELADTYTKKYNELSAETNTLIGGTPELLDTIGVSQADWNAKTKEQRNDIKEINRDLLQQNALIKTKFETELKYESAASDAKKESIKIANEVIISRTGGYADVTKKLPRELSRIDTNERIDTLGLDRNSGMYETDADQIKLEALRKRAIAYDEESKRLEKEVENAKKLDEATRNSNKVEEDKIATDLKALEVQNQTAEVLEKIKNLTERLIQLKAMDTARTDEATDKQKKNDVDKLENQKEYTDLAKKNIDNLRRWEADSLIDMAQNGKSFKDIMKNVWSSIGKDAIYGLMGITGQDSMFSKLLKGSGKTGGKKGNGGKNATGAIVNVPSLAGEDGSEAIIPLEKNTQNSAKLLTYAGNKLGIPVGTSGSEYTPYFNNKSLNTKPVVNVNIQQEESLKELQTANALMRQQNNLLLNTTQSGNTTIVTTAVSSDQVLQVLAENPDALQNILGRNKSNGYR